MREFERILGYHKQMNADAYSVPKGLKGKLTSYLLQTETAGGTTEKRVVFMPVRNAYRFETGLAWKKPPTIVVHDGETGNSRWQADDFQTGLLIEGYFDTRDAAASAAINALEEQGEERYWTVQKAFLKQLKAATAPINRLETPPNTVP